MKQTRAIQPGFVYNQHGYKTVKHFQNVFVVCLFSLCLLSRVILVNLQQIRLKHGVFTCPTATRLFLSVLQLYILLCNVVIVH